MKKIIAAAVATAFVAPAFAADVTVSGSFEWSYQETAGASSSDVDNVVSIKGSSETANGLTVSADINLTSNEAADSSTTNDAHDGSSSITIAGPFGSVDLGDTASAADAVNAINEFHVVTGAGATTAPDAAILWTLPASVDGLTVMLSNSPDSTGENGDAGSHTGIALKYTAGPVTVAYAKNDNDDGSAITSASAKLVMNGLTIGVESTEDDDEDGTATAAIDQRSVGVKYTMGDMTVFAANMETKDADAGTVSNDVTGYGLHYNLGGGLTAFVENSTDDKVTDSDTTAIGVTYAF